MATKKKYKNYKEYLKSDKWSQIKADYAEAEQTEECLICNACVVDEQVAFHYHHWNYPTDWNDDTHENLLFICEPCHTYLHVNFEHGSNITTLKNYLKLAYADHVDAKILEYQDIEAQQLGSILAKLDTEVVSNREGKPIRVNVKEPVSIYDVLLSKHVLNIQKHNTKIQEL